MGLLKSNWQGILLFSSLLLAFGANTGAQEKADPERTATTPAKSIALPAKSQAAIAGPAGAAKQSLSEFSGEREDGADVIREREEWFYKQRSSVGTVISRPRHDLGHFSTCNA